MDCVTGNDEDNCGCECTTVLVWQICEPISGGEAVGLTQNPEALRRWMVAGPEVMRMTAKFEASIEGMHWRMTSETRHHEQTKLCQLSGFYSPDV
ncbi:hypothetical protein Hamer_G020311 [Homarus americanus]|uniref:Uncharacterized protein n=1 Tax=Homarus americanus TaxID=6706 RepID=A0A8J5MML8_HOMAM|nr:hypothetical protein Hamer_G020311 [Homarus americanus]